MSLREQVSAILLELKETMGLDIDENKVAGMIVNDPPKVEVPRNASSPCGNMDRVSYDLSDLESKVTNRHDRSYSDVILPFEGIICSDTPADYITQKEDSGDPGSYTFKGRNEVIMSGLRPTSVAEVVNEANVAQSCINVSRVEGNNIGVSYYYGSGSGISYYEPVVIYPMELDSTTTVLGFSKLLLGMIGALQLMSEHRFTHYDLTLGSIRMAKSPESGIKVKYPSGSGDTLDVTFDNYYPVMYDYRFSSCESESGVYGFDYPNSGIYRAYYPISDILTLCMSMIHLGGGTRAAKFAVAFVRTLLDDAAQGMGLSGNLLGYVYMRLYESATGIPYNKVLAEYSWDGIVNDLDYAKGETLREMSTPGIWGQGLTSSVGITRTQHNNMASSAFLDNEMSRSASFTSTGRVDSGEMSPISPESTVLGPPKTTSEIPEYEFTVDTEQGPVSPSSEDEEFFTAGSSPSDMSV